MLKKRESYRQIDRQKRKRETGCGGIIRMTALVLTSGVVPWNK